MQQRAFDGKWSGGKHTETRNHQTTSRKAALPPGHLCNPSLAQKPSCLSEKPGVGKGSNRLAGLSVDMHTPRLSVTHTAER